MHAIRQMVCLSFELVFLKKVHVIGEQQKLRQASAAMHPHKYYKMLQKRAISLASLNYIYWLNNIWQGYVEVLFGFLTKNTKKLDRLKQKNNYDWLEH